MSTEVKHTDNTHRIQKILAHIGLASRREIESWISDGRLTISGKTIQPGCRIAWGDKVLLDGKQIKWPANKKQQSRVLLYHKPRGEICSRVDSDRPTVFAALPKPEFGRWVNVGRLDYNTSGLLIFTNDGEYANKLMHPKYGVLRTYLVKIYGDKLSTDVVTKLLQGVMLDDGMANFCSMKYMRGYGLNHWYNVTLKEGRNREVRRMFAVVNAQVNKLMRIAYGKWNLPKSLRPGEYVLV